MAAHSGRPTLAPAPPAAARGRRAAWRRPDPAGLGLGVRARSGAPGRARRPGASSGAATPPRCVRSRTRAASPRPPAVSACHIPRSRFARPRAATGWLVKRAGAAGGGHVRRPRARARQRAAAGTGSDEHAARLILPWWWATAATPVSWGSAVSRARPPRAGRSGSAVHSLRRPSRAVAARRASDAAAALAAHYRAARAGERRSARRMATRSWCSSSTPDLARRSTPSAARWACDLFCHPRRRLPWGAMSERVTGDARMPALP